MKKNTFILFIFILLYQSTNYTSLFCQKGTSLPKAIPESMMKEGSSLDSKELKRRTPAFMEALMKKDASLPEPKESFMDRADAAAEKFKNRMQNDGLLYAIRKALPSPPPIPYAIKHPIKAVRKIKENIEIKTGRVKEERANKFIKDLQKADQEDKIENETIKSLLKDLQEKKENDYLLRNKETIQAQEQLFQGIDDLKKTEDAIKSSKLRSRLDKLISPLSKSAREKVEIRQQYEAKLQEAAHSENPKETSTQRQRRLIEEIFKARMGDTYQALPDKTKEELAKAQDSEPEAQERESFQEKTREPLKEQAAEEETYTFRRNVSPEKFIDAQINNFEQLLDDKQHDKYTQKLLDLQEKINQQLERNEITREEHMNLINHLSFKRSEKAAQREDFKKYLSHQNSIESITKRADQFIAKNIENKTLEELYQLKERMNEEMYKNIPVTFNTETRRLYFRQIEKALFQQSIEELKTTEDADRFIESEITRFDHLLDEERYGEYSDKLLTLQWNLNESALSLQKQEYLISKLQDERSIRTRAFNNQGKLILTDYGQYLSNKLSDDFINQEAQKFIEKNIANKTPEELKRLKENLETEYNRKIPVIFNTNSRNHFKEIVNQAIERKNKKPADNQYQTIYEDVEYYKNNIKRIEQTINEFQTTLTKMKTGDLTTLKEYCTKQGIEFDLSKKDIYIRSFELLLLSREKNLIWNRRKLDEQFIVIHNNINPKGKNDVAKKRIKEIETIYDGYRQSNDEKIKDARIDLNVEKIASEIDEVEKALAQSEKEGGTKLSQKDIVNLERKKLALKAAYVHEVDLATLENKNKEQTKNQINRLNEQAQKIIQKKPEDIINDIFDIKQELSQTTSVKTPITDKILDIQYRLTSSNLKIEDIQNLESEYIALTQKLQSELDTLTAKKEEINKDQQDPTQQFSKAKEEARAELIKNSDSLFRKASLVFHPDKNDSPEAIKIYKNFVTLKEEILLQTENPNAKIKNRQFLTDLQLPSDSPPEAIAKFKAVITAIQNFQNAIEKYNATRNE